MKKSPDKSAFTETAIELGVERAFVEKDWYAVQVIKAITNFNHQEITPIFTGGTSLSKAHKLIKRFSEDIDFRVKFNARKTDKENLKQFKILRKELIPVLNSINGINVNTFHAFNDSKFFKIPLIYTPLFKIPSFIRNELLVEFSFSEPSEDIVKKEYTDFVENMSYEETGSQIKFDNAVNFLKNFIQQVP